MATKRVVVLSCDRCGNEGDTVRTHALGVGKKTVEVEACEKCWTRAEKVIEPLLEVGRRVPRQRRSRSSSTS